MKSILFGSSAVTFADAIYITIVSMMVVFFILFLISFVLSFFKYFTNYEDIQNKEIKDNKILEKSDKKQKFNMEKIKDETMLAAMMAALIEAAGDNKDSRIRIKNIREIK